MSDGVRTSVQTRIPSSGRRLPFLRKKSKSKDSPASQKQYSPASQKQYSPISRRQDSPVSPAEDNGNQTPPFQQQETWPNLNNVTASSDRTGGAVDHNASSPLPASPDEQTLRDERETFQIPQAPQDEPSYDLKPPPPTQSHANIEALAARLFSTDHLDIILSDHLNSARLTRFLNAYRPQHVLTLRQYADARKAVLAVEYANTVAGHLQTGAEHRAQFAAALDRGFQSQMNQDVHGLITDALPAYITHRLTQLVTDQLVKEITQNSAPIMKEMIPNLAEVYCITDPSLPDNPIVYASQEFYNVSQYGREYVIGRNCRFLQGPKTSNASVKRLIEALHSGQEVCETILNYRRDGSPFMNLLLIAPLYDNKGALRYFLGCQIDVSPLIDRGRGLDSLEQLLTRDRAESRFGGSLDKEPKYALSKFAQMLSEEETSSLTMHTRTLSDLSTSHGEASKASREPRRIIGMDDMSAEPQLWPHHNLGPSGRLPGVYQNYLLVRPYPSLRITFASPALRIPGLLQTKFLDRVGGPPHVRESILDALAHGTGLTAKIQWLTQSMHGVGGYAAPQMESRQRWIHCTPLLGSDERVGVWMVVIVENEEVTGSLKRPMPPPEPAGSVRSVAATSAGASVKERRRDLYAEYMRHDGQSRTGESNGLDLNVDEQFPDF